MNYNRINNIVGWLVFAIATFTYVSTMEPTASFWDCGEFISTSYRLGIPHPPGAPVFLLIGRMFSLFAGTDVTQVAYWINMVSALSSALTSLFLFWTITLLAKKLVKPENGESYDFGQLLAIMGAGLIGSLAYTFSDSAWFSAVEAEVYAMSSFFTAIVFWAILKWEAHADEEGADRWLVFIAYLVGLSIGVHLLNLVALPALGLVYYFKRYHDRVTNTGIAIALMTSALIIGVIMAGVITGLPSIAASFEIVFVNKFSLPFGSGIIFFILLLLGALVYGIWKSHITQKYGFNLVLTSFAFVMIGYYSYGVIVVRSNFEPTIDMNNPENVMTFTSYLKREQYGDRPLLWGPLYTVKDAEDRPTYIDGAPVYTKFPGENKYIKTSNKTIVKYPSKYNVLLPRMYSTEAQHVRAYQEWMNIPEGKKPTFFDNIGFMLKYQMGHMYWRYFAWNFIGRAGDMQDAGTIWPSDWFVKVKPSGEELVKLNDAEREKLMSDTKMLPSEIANNMARNNFYMLPFLAGVLGLYWQLNKSTRDFTVVGLFFFFTGLAIIIYLNQPPIEPRERDYTFAASFYAYAIWVGFSVLFLYDYLSKTLRSSVARAALSLLICFAAPAIMAAEGWDDHDRSQRYFQIDAAKNLLNSCDSNAILFTGGDNDTYPLWYVQEVEGFRTDVRVCNLSLLNTDWYIDQMKRPSYASTPLPISFESKQYVNGMNDYVYYDEMTAKQLNSLNIPKYLQAVKAQSPVVYRRGDGDNGYTLFPHKKWIIPVDTAAVLKNVPFPALYRPLLSDQMVWTYNPEGFDKKTLIILDMIVNNKWERPIYFSSTVGGDEMIGLSAFMQREGLAYRLMPFRVPGADEGWINTDRMYEKMMNNNFFFRNLDKSEVFYDDNYLRFAYNCRIHYAELAGQLLNESSIEEDRDPAKAKVKKDRAKEVLDYCLKVMPDASIPYDRASAGMIDLYFKLGEDAKAMQMATTMANRAFNILTFTSGEHNNLRGYYFKNLNQLAILQYTAEAMKGNNHVKEGDLYEDWLRTFSERLRYR